MWCSKTVTVHSADVDKIARAGQKTAELVQADVVISGGYGQGIGYRFNGLNGLKPDMINGGHAECACVC
jgi:uncharacterized protein